ncbi:hypothetical protein BCAR13_660088 [Paraburkholderia caribensis]|nr:hypothetical protein BCAR13_660088 [Paraburkholderia caribensis]
MKLDNASRMPAKAKIKSKTKSKNHHPTSAQSGTDSPPSLTTLVTT